jgi:hypothetical protein
MVASSFLFHDVPAFQAPHPFEILDHLLELVPQAFTQKLELFASHALMPLRLASEAQSFLAFRATKWHVIFQSSCCYQVI